MEVQKSFLPLQSQTKRELENGVRKRITTRLERRLTEGKRWTNRDDGGTENRLVATYTDRREVRSESSLKRYHFKKSAVGQTEVPQST